MEKQELETCVVDTGKEFSADKRKGNASFLLI